MKRERERETERESGDPIPTIFIDPFNACNPHIRGVN